MDTRKSPRTRYSRDKVTLTVTWIINVTFKIIKKRSGCQDVGYLHDSENLNWTALDKAALKKENVILLDHKR